MRCLVLMLLALAFIVSGCQKDPELEGPTPPSPYRSTYTQPDPILPPDSSFDDDSEVIGSSPMHKPLAGTEVADTITYGPVGGTTDYATHDERQDDLERINVAETPAARPVPAAETGFSYTLRKGDTLWDLSKRYLGAGNRWREIRDANPGVTPEALPIGKDIWIPAK